MKKLSYFKKTNNYFFLAIVLFYSCLSTFAQVIVPFTQRTSQYSPTKKIYNIKGDYMMIGNSNLTLQNYDNTTNNNNNVMQYVDIDGDDTTLNSSSANLTLSTENGALPSCSNIIYAGLYWTGRPSQSSPSNNTFSVTKTVSGANQTINNDSTIGNVASTSITNSSYSLNITRSNISTTNRSPIYTFTNGTNSYMFNYSNTSSPTTVTLSVNGGAVVNIPVTISVTGTTAVATLVTPYIITDGTVAITIKSLTRSTATNLSLATIQTNSSAQINVSGTIIGNMTITKNYDKRIISFKGPGASGYTQITANASDIYYPVSTDDYIYTAYAEVTDYVKTHGIGNYFAADIALREGNGGSTGYSGGWGLIVVYENSKMNYRDVTIFDGHAFIKGTGSQFNLPVSGFNTVQTGTVGVKLGMMASEGDVSLTGDYFRIQKLNTATYLDLSHSLNSTTNFFNSSINTGGNSRNPTLLNNTGIDICMFNVPNASNSVIGNSQTSTSFQYGSGGDTYVIFAIAMAVDAYIPNIPIVDEVVTINNLPPGTQPYSILPGQEVEFSIKLYNRGSEATTNTKVTIPIPFSATFVPGSIIKSINFLPLPTPNNAYFDPLSGGNGSIVWDLSNLPLPATPNTVLGTLTFKLKATEDCSILKNPNCDPSIAMFGSVTGIGANSLIPFSQNFIQGYNTTGVCIDEPINAPLSLSINSTDYIAAHCQNVTSVYAFNYCNINGTIAVSQISSSFPPGTRFYNQYPVTVTTTEYTASNPFPGTIGQITYYAVPPFANGCYFIFTISVTNNISVTYPTVSNLNGCGTGSITGLSYSESDVSITPAQFISSGGTISDTSIIVSITYSDVKTGVCPVVVTRTFKVVTNCINSLIINLVQTITIQDTTAPTWTTANNNLDRTVECNDATGLAAAQALFPTATDTCDTDVINIIKTAGVFVPNATCSNSGTYTNTWTVTDACLNQSLAFTQVITIQDTTAPTWTTAINNLDRTVECNDATGLAAAQALFPTATDICDADVTNIIKTAGVFVPNATCSNSGTYTNTWTVTDACLNQSLAFTQVITIQDTTAPTWTTAINNLDRTVECSDATGLAAAQALFPTATDTCDTDVINIIKTAGVFVPNATCSNSGTYTNTWTVTDACLNQSLAFTQVITIQDTTAPTWTTAINNLDRTVECNDATGLAAAQALFPTATDICDADVTNIIKTAGVFVPNATCSNSGTYTNTWTVTDACLNQSLAFTQVITIQDTTAPTWTTAINNLDRTVECNDATGLAAAQALFPTATDICDADVTNIIKTAGVFVPNATCSNSGTYTNTWTVTDACLNQSLAFTQVITIQDTTAPTWTTAINNLDRTVECSDATGLAAAQALFPTATDTCDTDVTNIIKTAGVFVPNATCSNSGTYTNTWTVTDACLNQSLAFTQVITIQDTTAPTWTTAINNLDRTVECNDATGLAAAQALFPTATDTCDTDVTNIIKTAGVFVPNATCSNSGTYTNTWTVTDACLNQSLAFTQVITIQDTTAPTWTTAINNLDRTVECNDATGLAAAQALFPTATDTCDTDVTNIIKTAGVFVPNATCSNSGTYTNTWTVTDACLNQSLVYTQVITIQDTTAPTWTTANNNLDRTVECNDATGLAAAQALFPTATDTCDTDVTNIIKTAGVFVPNATCSNSGTYTNTWTVTDACLNQSLAFTQVITIQDTTAPTWTTANNNLDRTVECSDATGLAAAQALFPTATDTCDTDVTNIIKTAGVFVPNATCSNSGTYTNTWTVTDACLNQSLAFTQVITIQDTTAPTWTTAINNLDRTVECNDATGLAAAQALFPTATDICDTDVTNIIKTAGVFVPNATCSNSGTYTNTWTVTDACLNQSLAFTQVITIQDTTAPTWTTANNNLDRTVECNDATGLAAAQALFPTATDICDADVTNIIKTAGVFVPNATCSNSGTYTNTWTVTDACLNQSLAFTQVITIQDTTAPTWTTAINNLDRTVECNDATGLAAAQALFPTATDTCDTDVTNIIKTAGVFVPNATCSNSGTYTNTWTVTDACLNQSLVYTQVITIQDTTAPTWTTAINNLDRTVECNDATGLAAAQALFPTATDTCDTDVTNIIKTAGVFVPNATCSNSGTYTNTWTVTDACLNQSLAFTQVITIQDTSAPTWTTAINNLDRTVECNDATGLAAAQALFPTATDTCDTDVTNIIKTAGVFVPNATCSNSGTYTNTWTVTDACLNQSLVYTQVITIQDTTAPTWTTAINNLDRTVECNDATGLAAAQALFPTATDTCDTDVTNIIKTAGVFVPNATCSNSGTYTNTWTVTDACLNQSLVYTQVITIQDTTAPTWTTAINNLDRTVECNDATGLAAAQALFPTATDTCDADVTNIIKTAGVFVPNATCSNSGTYTNTWTVTDACLNQSLVYTQVITIQDTTAPTWTTAINNLDRTVECNDATGLAAAQALFPTATDTCDTDVTNIIKTAGVFVPNATCSNSGTYTNTWTVTDACLNQSLVYTQVITIQDTTAPTWTTANNNLDRTVECNDATGLAAAQALFPTATDTCDTDVTNIIKTAGVFVPNATCSNSGTYTNTWTVTDACLNQSLAFTQVITIQDTTAPTWTTANNNLDRTVECNDATGLAAAQALFPTATDTCDTDVTNIIKTAGVFVPNATCSNSGTYTNTWTVTDACLNQSLVYTQVITIQDTTAPTWTTAINNLDRTVECNDATGLAAAQALFPTATDICDADVTNIIKTAGVFVPNATCSNSGTYTNTWTVTDACLNQSLAFTQVITIQDTTAPTWTTAINNLDRTVECSDATGLAAAQALFPTATDTCDTDVINIIKTAGVFVPNATCSNSGTYTNTWTVTDACLNQSLAFTQVITIQDTTAPTWTTAINNLDRTVECNDATGLAAAQALFPTATDICDADVTNIIKTAGVFVPNATCSNSGTYTNTWTVTDACLNQSLAFTQVITIQDTTAPTWTTAINNLDRTVECSDATGLAAAQALFPTATDTCDTDVTNIIKTAGVFVPNATCSNSGTYTNTWTVTDACLNQSLAFTQVITIQDTTAPTWTTAINNLDRTVECSDATGLAAAQALFPTATDTCDTDVTNIIKTAGVFVPNATCSNSGTYTNTWTVTDACLNQSLVYTQVITIQDTTKPTLVTPLDQIVNVDCSQIPAVPAMQFNDGCTPSSQLVVLYNETTFPISATGTYTIIRTWTVTDLCSNSQTFTQTINVAIDNYANEIVLTAKCNLNSETKFKLMDEILALYPHYPTTGIWMNVDNSSGFDATTTVFSSFNIPEGVYNINYVVADANCPKSVHFSINVDNDCEESDCPAIIVHNAITPNGDSLNDYFDIENIENFDCYPENTVEIFNRSGVKVYNSTNYDNKDVLFIGNSEGRDTINQQAGLQTDTYFYIIKYKTIKGNYYTKTGYLYLSK